jgi:hypothetical protein
MKRCESMLMGQAEALQAMFVSYARRAQAQEYQKNLESFFRMALKAQNQCRMTLETLAAIKNPPVVYTKQANIAHGPQLILPTFGGQSGEGILALEGVCHGTQGT